MEKETSLEKIIFENDEGFIIALGKDKLTYKGTVLENPKDLLNTPIVFEGTMAEYKGKEQFSFNGYKVQQSFTDFFLEKMVKGLSKKAITDIKIKCGDNFEKIINENPNALLSIKGVGEKSLSKIINSYNENKHLKYVADFLLPFGITNNAIKKIHDTYGNEAVEVLKENPYTLTTIKGISFKKADTIAVKMGLPLSSSFRLLSGIGFAIDDYFNSQGHTSIQKNILFEKSSEVLNTDEFKLELNMFENYLDQLIANESICTLCSLNKIYTNQKFKKMESYIFETLSSHKNIKRSGTLKEDIEKYIQECEAANSMKLDEKQKDAIRLVNCQYRCVYLAGYAGTGKSTSSKISMKIYEDAFGFDGVVGCALSGIAAKRIQTVTGYNSYTIHTLLGYRGGNDFEYNEENKLPYKFIMIDEASMIDTFLFYKLLCAIDLEKTAILIVGDPSQLKAVAPGNIFEDIINLKLVYGVKLDKVFRQTEEQMINVFATNFVRNGVVPENYKHDGYEDFKFHTHELQDAFKIKKKVSQSEYLNLQEQIKKEIVEKIKQLAYSKIDTISYWKSDVWKYITNFQIISPMKNGPLGTETLNEVIQSVFNANRVGDVFTINKKEFRFRDKVIHLQNENMKTITTEQYKEYSLSNRLKDVLKDEEGLLGTTKRVFNGQLGVIINVNSQDEIISVYYPNEKYITLYKFEHFKQRKIDLAYAITIHKSQGMEYNTIVLPMTNSHYVMLNNNLLYTAITRAKENLHIVGETFAFEHACKNKDLIKRNSVLQTLKQKK